MKRMILTLCAVVSVFLGTATAQSHALEVRLQNGDGLTSAMERAGCNREWLSRVMADNNIAVARLRRLPIGFSFRLPMGCGTKAPQVVAAQSLQLMDFDRTLAVVGHNTRFQEENTRLQAEVTRLNVQIEKLQQETKAPADQKALQSELALTKDELAFTKAELARVMKERIDGSTSATSPSGGMLRSAGIGAFLMAIASMIMFLHWRRAIAANTVPATITIWYLGKKHAFPLRSMGQQNGLRYGCPIGSCREGGRVTEDLKPSKLKHHLEEMHPELRITVVEARTPLRPVAS